MPTSVEIQRFETALAAHPSWPRAMCLGDSWFQYPPNPIDLHKQLRRIFKRTLWWNDSLAGRESSQVKMLLPRSADALGAYGFDALLVSLGGNDVVGTELAEFVKPREVPQSFGATDWGALPAPVLDHIRLSAFERTLDYVVEDYERIVQMRNEQAPQCEIVVHTYDYPWPDGREFELLGIAAGPWLQPFFDAVGMDDAGDQRTTAVWLIDQFARVLASLVERTPRMRLIDSRGVLPRRMQWANEIHPKKAGFARIAEQSWKPALAGLLE
jgi:hypothetical protein